MISDGNSTANWRLIDVNNDAHDSPELSESPKISQPGRRYDNRHSTDALWWACRVAVDSTVVLVRHAADPFSCQVGESAGIGTANKFVGDRCGVPGPAAFDIEAGGLTDNADGKNMHMDSDRMSRRYTFNGGSHCFHCHDSNVHQSTLFETMEDGRILDSGELPKHAAQPAGNVLLNQTAFSFVF